MDLSQTKLTKTEWESIEIPVNSDELAILKMICRGYHDVQTKHNTHLSLLGFLKIAYSETMENFLFTKYFAEIISKHKSLYDHKYAPKISTKIKIKTASGYTFLICLAPCQSISKKTSLPSDNNLSTVNFVKLIQCPI